MKPECPYRKMYTAVDSKRDKVYEGAVMCDLVDKWCLLEGGMECDMYEDFLKEEESERKDTTVG